MLVLLLQKRILLGSSSMIVTIYIVCIESWQSNDKALQECNPAIRYSIFVQKYLISLAANYFLVFDFRGIDIRRFEYSQSMNSPIPFMNVPYFGLCISVLGLYILIK